MPFDRHGFPVSPRDRDIEDADEAADGSFERLIAILKDKIGDDGTLAVAIDEYIVARIVLHFQKHH